MLTNVALLNLDISTLRGLRPDEICGLLEAISKVRLRVSYLPELAIVFTFGASSRLLALLALGCVAIVVGDKSTV